MSGFPSDDGKFSFGAPQDRVPPPTQPTSNGLLSTIVGAGAALGVAGFVTAYTVYKKCPPNKLLVVYGRGAGGMSGQGMRIIKNGGATVIPGLQEACYMSLEPMALNIPLEGALSLEKIRVNAPSSFTVAISPEDETAKNAARRLLMLDREQIEYQAEEVIIGQMRQVLAGMTIDEINRDREKFVIEVQNQCDQELQKLGLVLLNTNVKNITDESGVIEALGKKAAATAKQQALIDVATQERLGMIGVSFQEKERDISVSDSERDRDIGVRAAKKEATTHIEQLEADEMVAVNTAKKKKIESETLLAEAQATFHQKAEIARKEAEAAVAEAEANAQTRAALAYAEQVEAEERARLEAAAKAEKAKMIVDAEAKAEQLKIIAQGEAAAKLAMAEARANAEYAALSQKAAGLKAIVDSCGGSEEAYRLLLLEHIDKLAETSATAISNIKFDKVVVWDGGKCEGSGRGAVPDFIREVSSALPPTIDVLKDIAGVDLRASLSQQQPQKGDEITPDQLKVTSEERDVKGK
mmetsp:Transcript_46442/g.86288  ORF Transcript_46442/g.86288 Transcript_46442/m.86288 type:complete len:525 (-) Transcript_46442:228-1802(-)|eukprot:CAMPEP_0197445980 /NCGR_PEP_ID=MMETSP1175-20131217/11056_1 /TAXON_ID=1003142 /ORGANISM="Triceratium dubium, Strain CCMP147" /LENGTH=524 /DNA_ID=CAMNT_0042977033 /DNA_START=115 /DNA_END=1689 /DNA_ORIENTATION=+